MSKTPSNPRLTSAVVLAILWRSRRRLVVLTVLAAIIGVVIAWTTTSEYIAEARIMPELNNGSTDAFKRLASVAGFANLDLSESEGVEAVRPDLYPNVLQSTPFVLYLLTQSVHTKTGQSLTVTQFLDQHRGWSWRNWLTSDDATPTVLSTKNTEPLQLTARQQSQTEAIQERVAALMDGRSGVITITAKFPDPVVAATVAQLSMDYLTQYVTAYRTEKARRDLAFYTQRVAEARKSYQSAQYAVFHYNDGHRYMAVQTATIDRPQLEAELDISRQVYTELSRQLEQAKLKVQERTPVFKTLEPAKVPLIRASPRRIRLVVLVALAGFAIGSAWQLILTVNFSKWLRERMAD